MSVPRVDGGTAGSAMGTGYAWAMVHASLAEEDAKTMERLSRQCREASGMNEERPIRRKCPRKFTPPKRAEARSLRAQGWTYKRIAAHLGVHPGTVWAGLRRAA